ncbi:MAG TPA: sigma-70 family RNA polymerase sigma factor [Ktedonobacteraceae bacterium]
MQGFKGRGLPGRQPSQPIPFSVEELSDEALIHALALGVVWALEVLYQRYARLLYSVAYRMTPDHQIAEDLLQDTFVSVWQHAGSYSSQSGSVKSWLVSIIRHRAIDHLRKIRARADFKITPIEELVADESLSALDTWEEVWKSIQGAQIRNALKKLSNEQRMVIELAYFQGWTQAEIAKSYNIPLGTVKARMRLGLMRLKHLLEQMEGGV